MTKVEKTPELDIIGNGSATVFPFEFPAGSAAHIVVYAVGAAGELTLADPALFTILLGTGEEGGQCQFYSPPGVGENYLLRRETPVDQLVAVSRTNSYDPQVVERVWDKLTMIAQEHGASIDRKLTVPVGENPDTYLAEVLAATETVLGAAAEAIAAAEALDTAAYGSGISFSIVSAPQDIPLLADYEVDSVYIEGLALQRGDAWSQSGNILTINFPRAIGLTGWYRYRIQAGEWAGQSSTFNGRAAAVAAAITPGWPVGSIIGDGKVQYRYTGSGTSIADMPGWVPYREITPEHFGNIDGVNDEIQINAAITYADSLGGGDVWLRGDYVVAPSGTWSSVNGDLNVAVRVATTNPVTLRGVKNVSRITLTGTRICHVVGFGQRVDTIIVSRGGIDSIEVVGNRSTAVEEGVAFSGGIGIYVAGPAEGVRVTNNYVHDTYAYGIGFQRAYFANCLIEGNHTQNTGGDGIDCKFDYGGDYSVDAPGTLEAGNPNNWVRDNFVEAPALRWAELSGLKAGLDLREGWSSDNNKVMLTVPAVGFRTQHDDETITTPLLGIGSLPPESEDARMRWHSSHSNIEVWSEGTLTGLDVGAATINATCVQAGVYGSVYSNVSTTGGIYGVRSRRDRQVFSGVQARNASNTGFTIAGTASATANNVQVYGLALRDNGTDLRITGDAGYEPVGSGMHGVVASTVTIDAGVTNSTIVSDTITTLTDAGTNTLRLSGGAPATFRAGRNADQHFEISGDGSGSYITGVCNAGAPKNTFFRGGANSLVTVVDAPTGQSISLRIGNTEHANINTTGLNLASGKVVKVASTQVIAARRAGWTPPTGTATRTSFDTTTVTTAQLAERLKALLDDLIAHGLIGA